MEDSIIRGLGELGDAKGLVRMAIVEGFDFSEVPSNFRNHSPGWEGLEAVGGGWFGENYGTDRSAEMGV